MSLPAEHAIAKLDDCIPYPRFDRAERGAQDASDLAVGVPAVEGERDGLSLQVAELVHAVEQPLAVQGVCRGPVGLVRRGI